MSQSGVEVTAELLLGVFASEISGDFVLEIVDEDVVVENVLMEVAVVDAVGDVVDAVDVVVLPRFGALTNPLIGEPR